MRFIDGCFGYVLSCGLSALVFMGASVPVERVAGSGWGFAAGLIAIMGFLLFVASVRVDSHDEGFDEAVGEDRR